MLKFWKLKRVVKNIFMKKKTKTNMKFFKYQKNIAQFLTTALLTTTQNYFLKYKKNPKQIIAHYT